MQKMFQIQRWGLLVALVMLLVLAACTAQLPAVTPESSAVESAAEAGATGTPAEEETTPESADEATEDEAMGEETASETSSETVAETPAVSGLELAGGAALPSDETHKGLTVGFTEDGYLYRGDPDASIVLIEYSDYGCPFCNRHFIQTEPAIDESYVRTGQVRTVFHDFPLASLHPNAPAAHAAALCVAEQGSAVAFWEMRAELFRSVDQWQSNPEPLPVFAGLAEQVGADAAAYEECISAGETAAEVEARVEAGFARGFSATPSFQVVRLEDTAIFPIIGAQPYEQFAAAINSALAGEMPVVAAAEPQDEGIPFWATAEGWAPDPERPGFNVAGDQYRGDVDAPLTVIEFSDFQCPYCQRHTLETQPVLDEKYVDSGKVLWVHKHFPLNIHPQAPAAGVASECAAEQGQFWEMHDALFNSVSAWSITDPNPVFESLAADLGLDADAFAACLVDPAMLARVNEDMAAGGQFVQGTPTFIIVRGEQGSIIPGALPEASFSEVLDAELAAAGVTN